MRIAYFVHDLNDAAVAKRVAMLKAGGAKVTLLGFRRTESAPKTVAGAAAHDLGRTRDARLASRALAVAINLIRSHLLGRQVASADAVIGRNLETFVLASAARRLHAPHASLAYECLDVHRMMLGAGLASRTLRRLESRLLEGAQALIVSSPGFVDHYFEPAHKVSARSGLATLLVENKVFGAQPVIGRRPEAGPPWRIGWFGMIRCRRSLDALCDLAARRPGLVELIIRGKPSYTEFDDFDAQVAAAPGVSYLGPYQPGELPQMYGEVHFNWSVDYFQDEGNSRWLLPNRLYEGGLHGAPVITRQGCETARWLSGRGLGLVFDKPETELEAFLDALTPEAYDVLSRTHLAAPREAFIAGQTDCDALVAALGGRVAGPVVPAESDWPEPHAA